MRVIAAYLLNTSVNVVVGLLVALALGPDEFGRFALTLAVAAIVQSLLFDWLRFAAARFASPERLADEPLFLKTLEASFILEACGLVVLLGLGLVVTGPWPLSRALVILAIFISIINGLFDFRAALIRARFADRRYAHLLLVKNLLAVCVTGGLAFYVGTALAAVSGVAISMIGALLSVPLDGRAQTGVGLWAAFANLRATAPKILNVCLRYSLPIVLANGVYFAIPLLNRAFVARSYGFAETGQFSLAYDLGIRLFMAIGTALDVLLFQLAVRADEQVGQTGARVQLSRNLTFVIAVLVPVCCGAWLVLPSLEALVVPMAYRGPFAHYFELLLPGLLAWSIATYGLNPSFQIAQRTTPMLAAGAIACLVDVALMSLLPHQEDATHLAQALTGSLLAGAATLWFFAARHNLRGPAWRDGFGLICATGLMIAAVWPLRALPPGLATLALQVVVGCVVYGAVTGFFDVAQIRSKSLLQLRAAFARQTSG